MSDHPPSLEARVALVEANSSGFPCPPRCATIVEGIEVADGGDDLVWVLEELYTETLCDMEGDVAMQQPHTRVVEWERDGEIATGIDGLSIASDGVGEVI